jgi:translocation and assembly module TamA
MIQSTRILLGAAIVLACASTEKKNAPVVRSLKIEGARRISPRTIKQKILTTETSKLPFTSKKYFDPLVWETDLRRIERVYEAAGYYRAKVTSAEVKPGAKNVVDLVVHVVEDQPVRIASVDVLGLDPLPGPEREAVLDRLPLEPGEPFKESAWQNGKTQIVSRLKDRGHAQVDLDGQASVDVTNYRAPLKLVVRPGPQYHFGDIHVRTQEGPRVPAWRIWEQVNLELRHNLYSEEALEDAQRRVFSMGVFSTARVTEGEADPATGTLAVEVSTREAPFRTLRLGGGVGIDQIRQEARLLAEWTNRNFLGGLRKLTASLTVGFAFIPSTYAVLRDQIDEGARFGPIYRAKLQLEQPRMFGRPSLRGISMLESERTLEEAYDAIGARTQNGVSWQPYTTITVFPNYHLEGYHLNGPSTSTVATAPLALGCHTDPCFILLSYLEQVVTWDRRDSPLEPKKGTYLSLSVQEGGGPLQGDFTYLRVLPEARGFFTVGEERWLTVAARLQVGTLIPSSGKPDDSAAVTRFAAGGAMSMRGFSVRRLSPLLLAPGPKSTPGQDPPLLTLPIGGNGIIDGSLEARTALTSSFALAGFADFGTVTREEIAPSAVESLQWAVGLGIRYLTAIGPIRLDIAYRLPLGRPPPLFDEDGVEITYERNFPGDIHFGRENGDHVNKSCFGIGGTSKTWVRDGLCVFHISIGEAF